MPVMESKPADVFAYAMFAVEVFTGKIPFEEQKNEAVVLRISQGGRPEMPENAQAVGLTDEMWKILDSCWQQTPKKRPTMEEVVRRWEKFVEYDDNGNVVTEYVQIFDASASFSVSSSTCHDPLRKPTGRTPGARTRAITEAPRPVTKPDAPRSRVMSEVPHQRTNSRATRHRKTSEAAHPLANLEAPRRRGTSEAVQPQTRSEVVRQGTNSEVQPREKPRAPPPGESFSL